MDALSWKSVSMDSLAHLSIEEWPLSDIILLVAYRLVRLDILDSRQILVFIGDQLSLVDQIRAR